jgi:hypothetical protein
LIAFNTNVGIRVFGAGATGNSIRGNSIHSNTLGGIDNNTGGNQEFAPPVISGVSANGVVQGFSCPGCVVDVYVDNGNQGRFHQNSTTADSSGFFSSFIQALSSNVTATATSNNNTSEFSSPFAIAEACDGIDNDGDTVVDEGNTHSDGDGQADCIDNDDDDDGVPDEADSCSTAADDEDGFQDSDGCPDPDNDLDGVCDAGQTSPACAGSDTGKYCFDPAGTLACHLAPPSDCRNIADDIDAFKDTDGCPEPDNDNDSFPDATDACPGTDSGAGGNGMLGSPQDLNHNGISDAGEAALTTDDVPTYAFEDRDGVLDTDGCHDSPGEDFDGDGYTDDVEALQIGTDAGYPCGKRGWPSNLVDPGVPFPDNALDIFDVTSFLGPVRRLDTNLSVYADNKRWDLLPGPGPFMTDINILDLTALFNGPDGSGAYPPMFGGGRAFDRICPAPP